MSALWNRPWFAGGPVMHRTRRIAHVLSSHGLGAIMHQSGLGRFTPRALRTAVGDDLTQAQHLGLALGELGATFTKLGQMLSTRADLLPADVLEELARLQDHAPPIAFSEVRRVIEAELHQPLEDLFVRFDESPLASASIGQVHAAELGDGARVVVKVQRPGVREEVEQDLAILTNIVDLAEHHTQVGEDYDLRALLSEFAHTIRAELDYVREGQHADRLRHSFGDDPDIHIPRVHWKRTSSQVLTLERVEGIKITHLAALDRAGIPRRRIAEAAVRTFLRQLLEFGFFHADPHPGNFFVEPSGRIALVDFGMVGRVSDLTQHHLLRAGLCAMELDAEGLAEELYALGVAGVHADRRAFEKDLDHIIGRYGMYSLHELSAAEVTRDLSEVVFRHKLQLPSELALLLRVISMSEGMGLMLDPHFHYLEYASPIIRRHWQRRTSIQTRLQEAGRSMVEMSEFAVMFPRRAKRLMSRIERGEVEFSIRHENLSATVREFQHMTNRLSMALIVAASVVALSVAMGVYDRRELQPYLHWLFVCGFVFTLVFGAALVVNIWRSGQR